ncbi:hypothetical protein FS837_001342, partial [Tulasnella sp. UAMH 9824]
LDEYDLVDLVLLERLQERVQVMVNKTIETHNKSGEEKHIALVNKGDWNSYGNVDSSDAIMEYARSELDFDSGDR